MKTLRLRDVYLASPVFTDLIREISSAIETLVLELPITDEDSIPDFTALGHALVARNVATLQSVTFECRGGLSTSLIRARLEQDMPDVCRSKVVHVVPVNE